MWVVLLALFVVVATLMVMNGRARARLEQRAGKSDDPTRRHWWMRIGG
jgi:hypothetical protein